MSEATVEVFIIFSGCNISFQLPTSGIHMNQDGIEQDVIKQDAIKNDDTKHDVKQDSDEEDAKKTAGNSYLIFINMKTQEQLKLAN